MIVVQAVILFPADQEEQMQRAAADVERFCQELPGCLAFELSLSVSQPGRLLCTEAWTSMETFEGHVTLSDANPDLAPWRDLIREVKARLFESNELTTGDTHNEEIQEQ